MIVVSRNDSWVQTFHSFTIIIIIIIIIIIDVVVVIIIIIFSFSALLLSGWNVTVLMSSHFGFSIQLSALHTYVIDRTASFYLILLKTPEGNLLAVETFPGSATTENITGLRPSTMYRISVYGIDETGQAYKTGESLASTTDGKLHILHCFCFLLHAIETKDLKLKDRFYNNNNDNDK